MTERPELVLALVCPLGAAIDALEHTICDELRNFGYHCEKIGISDLLRNLDFWSDEPDASENTRIRHRQACALEFRRKGGPDVLARAAITAIRDRRRNHSSHPDKPADACAYILRQLKHPKEIELLRRVYGESVIVVAGHSPEDTRVRALADAMAQKERKASPDAFENAARSLIHIDEKEEQPNEEDDKLGQNTRDAYPMADVFVSLAQNDDQPIRRFIQLLFGHPFHTPTPEELAMNQANAISLRSSDERRQVGAVVVKRTHIPDSKILDADVIASGMNEVPRRQGGFYWEGEFADARDQALRRSSPVDLEERIKTDALREIAARLMKNDWLKPELAALEEVELTAKLFALLKRTQFMDISEFMRQVHAEMASLLDAAKRGVPVRGCEMYVTTFPCHNCAKHIIASGITKVVYLEPYPKSRAEMLHREEIALYPENEKSVGDKVHFVPFTGVAPRQFPRLFSMLNRGKKRYLSLNDWNEKRKKLPPRYYLANAAQAYTYTEREALELLPQEYRRDRASICP